MLVHGWQARDAPPRGAATELVARSKTRAHEPSPHHLHTIDTYRCPFAPLSCDPHYDLLSCASSLSSPTPSYLNTLMLSFPSLCIFQCSTLTISRRRVDSPPHSGIPRPNLDRRFSHVYCKSTVPGPAYPNITFLPPAQCTARRRDMMVWTNFRHRGYCRSYLWEYTSRNSPSGHCCFRGATISCTVLVTPSGHPARQAI